MLALFFKRRDAMADAVAEALAETPTQFLIAPPKPQSKLEKALSGTRARVSDLDEQIERLDVEIAVMAADRADLILIRKAYVAAASVMDIDGDRSPVMRGNTAAECAAAELKVNGKVTKSSRADDRRVPRRDSPARVPLSEDETVM